MSFVNPHRLLCQRFLVFFCPFVIIFFFLICFSLSCFFPFLCSHLRIQAKPNPQPAISTTNTTPHTQTSTPTHPPTHTHTQPSYLLCFFVPLKPQTPFLSFTCLSLIPSLSFSFPFYCNIISLLVVPHKQSTQKNNNCVFLPRSPRLFVHVGSCNRTPLSLSCF